MKPARAQLTEEQDNTVTPGVPPDNYRRFLQNETRMPGNLHGEMINFAPGEFHSNNKTEIR